MVSPCVGGRNSNNGKANPLKIFYQFFMFEGSQGRRVEGHTLTLEQLDNGSEVTIAIKAKQIPWKPRNQKEVLFKPLVTIMLLEMVHTRFGWFSQFLTTVGFGSFQNFKESLGSLEIIRRNSSNHWLQARNEKMVQTSLGRFSLSLSLFWWRTINFSSPQNFRESHWVFLFFKKTT